MRRSLRAALLMQRRPAVAGAGRARPVRSDGYEFAELRGYVGGDDPRRIDWAATARVGALQTRVMYEEHGLYLAVALDGSPSMRVGRDRSCYARAFDAAAAWLGLAEGADRCARIVDERLIAPRERRGRSAARACLALEDRALGSFAGQLAATCALVPTDASLLLVSDFFEVEPLAGGLGSLARRCDCTALIVRDPWFAGLGLAGFVRLRDAEDGRTRRLFVGARERARYLAASAAREAAARARLRGLGIRAAVLGEEPNEALQRAFAEG
jgi:uncharacterized protein (DUF58 family)